MMDYEQLGRKELQALAKQYKIKANQSNAALVEALQKALIQDYETSMIEEEEMVESNKPKAPAVKEQPIVEAASNVFTEPEVTTLGKRKQSMGPFSIDSMPLTSVSSPLFSKVDTSSSKPIKKFVLETKKVTSDSALKVGDSVKVCVDSVWITSVIKRVNKASYRVQMESGEEATFKPADMCIEEEVEVVDDCSTQPEPAMITEETTPIEEEVPMEVEVENESSEEEAKEFESPITEEDNEADVPMTDNANDSLLLDSSEIINETAATVVEELSSSVLFSATTSPAARKPTYRASTTSSAAMASSRPSLKELRLPQSARKSMSAATPSRVSISASNPSWDSSIKPKFHLGSSDANPQSKTPGSAAKKMLATTPTRQPAIVPKLNAAARKRMEAAEKKREIEKTISQPPLKRAKTNPTPVSTTTTGLMKSTGRSKTIPSSLPPAQTVKPKVKFAAAIEAEAKAAMTISSSSSSAAVTTASSLSAIQATKTVKTVHTTSSSTSAASRKPVTNTPNFERLHQKSFNQQKSIASCVARDTKINKNMDEAFAKAQENSSTTVSSSSTAEVAQQENVSSNFVTKRKAPAAVEKKPNDDSHPLLGALLTASDQPPAKKAKVEPPHIASKASAMVDMQRRKTIAEPKANTTKPTVASSAALSRKSVAVSKPVTNVTNRKPMRA